MTRGKPLLLGAFVLVVVSVLVPLGPVPPLSSAGTVSGMEAQPNVLTVQVVASDDGPIPNARVTVYDSGTEVASNVTNALGLATTPLADGTYTVRVEAGGYETTNRTLAVSGETHATVRLNESSGPTTGYVDFQLKATDRSTGCAVDANYDLTNTGDFTFSESGSLGADGYFETTVPVEYRASGDPLPTDYQLTVTEPNYDTLRTTRSVDNNTRADVFLDPKKGSLTIDVSAELNGVQEPAEGAVVTLVGRCPGTGAIAFPEIQERTNGSGVVTFDGLPPADYTVEVTKVGYEKGTATVDLDANGSASRNVDLELLDPSNVSVTVTERLRFVENETVAGPGQVTKPLAGANVTFHYLDADEEFTRTTDAAGNARLTQMPPGRYVITAEKDATTRNGALVGWNDDRAARTVNIGEDANVSIELLRNQSSIDTAAVLNGKLRRDLGENEFLIYTLETNRSTAIDLTGPAKRYQFKLEHVETGFVVTVRSDQAGRISESLPSGAYEVWTPEEVEWTPAEPAKLRTHLLGTGGTDRSGGPDSPPHLLLNDTETWTADPGIVLVPELGTLVLSVRRVIDDPFLGTFENPIENASVEVTDAENHTFESRGNVHGYAVFPRIHPGPATVTIRHPGYRDRTVTINVSEWSAGRTPEEVLSDSFNVTEERRVLPMDGGDDFTFTIKEFDNERGEYENASGLVLVTSTDDDREIRYHTFVEHGDSLGPFPPGEYDVYLQAVRDNESASGCDEEFVVPAAQGVRPGSLSFKFGAPGTTPGASTIPMELNLVDSVTDEPINTSGRSDVEIEYKYLADPCDSFDSTETKTFRTGPDGEEVSEVRFKPRFEGGDGGLERLEILEPAQFDKPYARFPTQTTFPFGLEYIFHVEPNSATLTGRVNTSNGGVLPNASVRVGRIDATTNDTGQYEIAGVPNGTYGMTFSKRGYYSNVTTIEVTVPPSDEPKVVDKPSDQPVELEELPEPVVDIEWPIDGVFLDGVPLRYRWHVNVTSWPIEPSRPNGDDEIEAIEYYFVINGSDRKFAERQVDVSKADLPVNESVGLNVASLVTDLSPGEISNISNFYVVLETAKQGHIRYPRETAVDRQAYVMGMPEWMSASYRITEFETDGLVEQLAAVVSPSRDEIRRILDRDEEEGRVVADPEVQRRIGGGVSFEDLLGRWEFAAVGGVEFEAYKPPGDSSSANYDVGYRMYYGGKTLPAGDKLLRQYGLMSVGFPQFELEGWLTSTLHGERQTRPDGPDYPLWESNAAVSAGGGGFVSAKERVIPFFVPTPPITGAFSGSYELNSTADLPRGRTQVAATVDTNGNLTASPVDLVKLFADVSAGGIPVGEVSIPTDLALGVEWDFEANVTGTTRDVLKTEAPAVVPLGVTWGEDAAFDVSIRASVGWRGGLSEGLKPGFEGNLTNFKTKDRFFDWLNGTTVLGFTVSVGYVGGEIGDAELENVEIKIKEGSPSAVEFQEFATPRHEFDRYWTSLPDYGTLTSWGGNGTLVRNAFPFAEPSLAVVDDGAVHAVVARDRAARPPGEALTLRHVNLTGDAATELPAPAANGTERPTFLSQDGTQFVAFTRHDVEGEFTVASYRGAELAYAVRTNGTWNRSVTVTDDGNYDLGPAAAACGDGRWLVGWLSDPRNPLSVQDVGLRYAFVNRTGATTGPRTLVDRGVWSPPAVACPDSGGVVAYSNGTRPDATGSLTGIAAPGNNTVSVAAVAADGTVRRERLGSGHAVDALAIDPDRVLVAFSDRNEGTLRYAVVETTPDLRVIDEGLVADRSLRDLQLVERPGDDPVLVGLGGAGRSVHARTFDGANWTDRTTLLSGQAYRGLSTAFDPTEGRLYVGTVTANTTTPVADHAPTDVDVHTFEGSFADEFGLADASTVLDRTNDTVSLDYEIRGTTEAGTFYKVFPSNRFPPATPDYAAEPGFFSGPTETGLPGRVRRTVPLNGSFGQGDRLQEGESYVFEAYVTNRAGPGFETILARFVTPSGPLNARLTGTAVNRTAVAVTANVTGFNGTDGANTYYAYRERGTSDYSFVGGPVWTVPDTEKTTTIAGLDPGTTYEVVLTVRTPAGETFKEKITVTTDALKEKITVTTDP